MNTLQNTSVGRIEVINLSPRETNCAICGKDLLECRLGVPMFEGCLVPNDWPHEWGGADACRQCFDKHERGEFPTWPNPPRENRPMASSRKASEMSAAEARQAEGQWRLMYAIVVAGKSADFARGAMDRFLANSGNVPPFRYLELLVQLKRLGSEIRKARMGNYSKLEKSFTQLAKEKPDLQTATPVELEKIHGVGPKTSRFAILWFRPKERHAALDTHVLKWLRFIGVDAPRSTPNPVRYAQLETLFIAEADRRGLTPRRLDALIWEFCSSYGPGEPSAWPEWLQREPAPVPGEIMQHILTYT